MKAFRQRTTKRIVLTIEVTAIRKKRMESGSMRQLKDVINY